MRARAAPLTEVALAVQLLQALVGVKAELRAGGAGEFLGTFEVGAGDAVNELIAVELVDAFQRLALVGTGAGHHVKLLRALACVELVSSLALDRVAVFERVLPIAEDDRTLLGTFD